MTGGLLKDAKEIFLIDLILTAEAAIDPLTGTGQGADGRLAVTSGIDPDVHFRGAGNINKQRFFSQQAVIIARRKVWLFNKRVVLAADLKKCTKPFVPDAIRNAKFHLSRAVTVPSIAKNAFQAVKTAAGRITPAFF